MSSTTVSPWAWSDLTQPVGIDVVSPKMSRLSMAPFLTGELFEGVRIAALLGSTRREFTEFTTEEAMGPTRLLVDKTTQGRSEGGLQLAAIRQEVPLFLGPALFIGALKGLASNCANKFKLKSLGNTLLSYVEAPNDVRLSIEVKIDWEHGHTLVSCPFDDGIVRDKDTLILRPAY